MTEKRFIKTIETFGGFCDILDNGKVICSVRLEYADGLVDRLNEMHEINGRCNREITLNHQKILKLMNENEELKKQLENCEDARQSYKQDWKACSSYCDEYIAEIHTLKDNIKGLKEENEWLTQENQKLDEKVCSLTLELVTTKSYKQLEKELNRFKKENKQLKKEKNSLIKDYLHFKRNLLAAIYNERTDLGRSTLLQLAKNMGIEVEIK